MNWVFTCLLANKCTVIDNSVSLALLCVRNHLFTFPYSCGNWQGNVSPIAITKLANW